MSSGIQLVQEATQSLEFLNGEIAKKKAELLSLDGDIGIYNDTIEELDEKRTKMRAAATDEIKIFDKMIVEKKTRLDELNKLIESKTVLSAELQRDMLEAQEKRAGMFVEIDEAKVILTNRENAVKIREDNVKIDQRNASEAIAAHLEELHVFEKKAEGLKRDRDALTLEEINLDTKYKEVNETKLKADEAFRLNASRSASLDEQEAALKLERAKLSMEQTDFEFKSGSFRTDKNALAEEKKQFELDKAEFEKDKVSLSKRETNCILKEEELKVRERRIRIKEDSAALPE